MDFIERLFGISPDYGSGATETAIVLALLALFAIAYGLRKSRKRRTPA
jgi:hypothetical protein